MATTVTLQNTINWSAPFIGFQPVTIGASSEPAISSANTIMQTILAPPFVWRWNRATTTFTTSAGTQDYSVSIPTFGFIEKASIAVSGGQTFELEVRTAQAEAVEQSRPTWISTQSDDDAGNIKFRLLPVPDQAYTVTVTYQNRAQLMTATTSLWSPIPDYFQYIYNWGFLSMMLDFVDSSRAMSARQKFVAALVSAAEGLDEAEKNVFISAWLGELRQVASVQSGQQLGARGRGV